MGELKAKEYKRFEDIKHIRADEGEYWLARELSIELEYIQWRNFSKVLDKARLACKNSGFDIDDHFAEVSKMVEIGSGTSRSVIDYELSRYACYLIVQNGDPRKEVIALGQTYFAIQTRRQEVADYFNQLDEDNKRLIVRENIQGAQAATATHYTVGKKVRGTFRKVYGSGFFQRTVGLGDDE